jgi:CRP/FNR family transcriptional regulator, cyclic AMP receptor protein
MQSIPNLPAADRQFVAGTKRRTAFPIRVDPSSLFYRMLPSFRSSLTMGFVRPPYLEHRAMSGLSSSSLEQRHFPAGAVLIAEGGRSASLLVLRRGEVEISRNGQVITTVGQPGAVFGEMSLLLDAPHSATVRALSPVEVYVMADATAVLAQDPQFVLQIARLLAQRVANTTAALVEAGRSAQAEASMVLPQAAVVRLDRQLRGEGRDLLERFDWDTL